MGKLTRKCDFCKVDDTRKEEMVAVEKQGKRITYKYYHERCHGKFLKQQAFREQERQELDRLTEVIKSIYGVKVLPHSIYPFLQDLRNGTKFFGKYDYKYKEGYPYDLIAEAFEYVSESIEYANAHKNFNGFTNAFRYGLAIVCDKLMIVENMRRQREQQAQIIDKHVANRNRDADEFETSYKPKERTNNLTDFLDE